MSVATWREHPTTGVLTAYVEREGQEIEATWAPQPGSQEAFLTCPVFEALYEGTRGPGKTDALLMDFAQDVGKGWGAEWQGILFRRTFPELEDVIKKSKKWFPKIWPGARYNESRHEWKWPSGEALLLRFMMNDQDYWNYHGHAYPWIAFEEITNWPTPDCYLVMMSCSRSTIPAMPRKYRGTCNPYGVGHNWVKKRFRLPIARGQVVGPIITDSRGRDGKIEPRRVAIHGRLAENKILLHAEPDYLQKLGAAARNSNELRAWQDGDWDIVAGGICDDLWRADTHVLPNFPFTAIPPGWTLTRSYDHGQSRPFSYGLWAESNGEPFIWEDKWIGLISGDLIRVGEWYGWNGEDNVGVRMLSKDIAQGIRDREDDWGIAHRVRRGPADRQIFVTDEGTSIAEAMATKGVHWDAADQGPGSRKQGWDKLREMLKGALPGPNGYRESAGLFVCERCSQFRRTVPVLPRSNKDLDDVDTSAEDHIGDETSYRVRWQSKNVRQGGF